MRYQATRPPRSRPSCAGGNSGGASVAFGGFGAAWNDFARFKAVTTVPTGGVGFRYEIASKYGINMGLDLAFGPDNTAVYVQVGSAWARP